MYDKHIIYPDSLRNDGDAGWRVGVRLPYYRGQVLSAVEDIALTVDGEKVPRADVRFTVRGKTWTLDQLETTYDERWEFGEVADVSVRRPGASRTCHGVRMCALPICASRTCHGVR